MDLRNTLKILLLVWIITNNPHFNLLWHKPYADIYYFTNP